MNDPKRIRWDLFVMVLATWNCFSIPFNVAFEPEIMEQWYFVALNFLIDFLFVVDILINFRTTFINPKTGDEISDPRAISRNYVKSRFWIDLFATIPFDSIGEWIIQSDSVVALQLFGLLKLIRVLRLSRIIMYMNLREETKMGLKLAKLVFFLVMYLHCLGCLWFVIVKPFREWIPPLDYVWVETNIYEESVSM